MRRNCGCPCSCSCQNRNANMYTNCPTNCSSSQVFPNNYLYGHAYTPNQTMQETFTPADGLQNGSLFPELVSPYYPGQSMEWIEYLKTSNRNGGCGCE